MLNHIVEEALSNLVVQQTWDRHVCLIRRKDEKVSSIKDYFLTVEDVYELSKISPYTRKLFHILMKKLNTKINVVWDEGIPKTIFMLSPYVQFHYYETCSFPSRARNLGDVSLIIYENCLKGKHFKLINGVYSVTLKNNIKCVDISLLSKCRRVEILDPKSCVYLTSARGNIDYLKIKGGIYKNINVVGKFLEGLQTFEFDGRMNIKGPISNVENVIINEPTKELTKCSFKNVPKIKLIKKSKRIVNLNTKRLSGFSEITILWNHDLTLNIDMHDTRYFDLQIKKRGSDMVERIMFMINEPKNVTVKSINDIYTHFKENIVIWNVDERQCHDFNGCKLLRDVTIRVPMHTQIDWNNMFQECKIDRMTIMENYGYIALPKNIKSLYLHAGMASCIENAEMLRHIHCYNFLLNDMPCEEQFPSLIHVKCQRSKFCISKMRHLKIIYMDGICIESKDIFKECEILTLKYSKIPILGRMRKLKHLSLYRCELWRGMRPLDKLVTLSVIESCTLDEHYKILFKNVSSLNTLRVDMSVLMKAAHIEMPAKNIKYGHVRKIFSKIPVNKITIFDVYSYTSRPQFILKNKIAFDYDMIKTSHNIADLENKMRVKMFRINDRKINKYETYEEIISVRYGFENKLRNLSLRTKKNYWVNSDIGHYIGKRKQRIRDKLGL